MARIGQYVYAFGNPEYSIHSLENYSERFDLINKNCQVIKNKLPYSLVLPIIITYKDRFIFLIFGRTDGSFLASKNYIVFDTKTEKFKEETIVGNIFLHMTVKMGTIQINSNQFLLLGGINAIASSKNNEICDKLHLLTISEVKNADKREFDIDIELLEDQKLRIPDYFTSN